MIGEKPSQPCQPEENAWAGWFVLDDLQEGVVKARRALDPADNAMRGREILSLQKSILVATAVVVGWAVLFKLPL